MRSGITVPLLVLSGLNEARSFPGGSAANTIHALLKGKGLGECGCLGDSVARFSLTKPGPGEGFPTPVELAQRYHELYNQQL